MKITDFLKPLPISELDETIREALSRLRSDPFQEIFLVLPERSAGLRRRIRNCLLQQGRAASGIHFLPLTRLVRRILSRSGRPVVQDDLDRRWLALEAVIQSDLPSLQYFDTEQIRDGRGYARAIERNIRACERAGLGPRDLRDEGQDRLTDLAMMWEKADSMLDWPEPVTGDAENGDRVHPGLSIKTFLEQDVSPPPNTPPILAVLDDPTVLEKNALKKLKETVTSNTLEAYQLVTPLPVPGEPDWEAPPAEPDASSLDRLRSRLFSTQRYLETDDSSPADGTVRFEEYSVPEREGEATLQWILQHLEGGIAPHKIGVIVAGGEGKGTMFSLLRHVQTSLDQAIPIDLAGGLPLVEIPRGSSLMLLVRSLEHFLRQEEMIRLLPRLEVDTEEDASKLSMPTWRRLIFEFGMLGGSPSRPDGAMDWVSDMDRTIRTLNNRLEEVSGNGEDRRRTYRADTLRSWKQALERHREPVGELQAISSGLIEDGSSGLELRELWARIHEFCGKYLPIRFQNLDFTAQIEEQVRERIPGAAATRIRGTRALRLLRNFLQELRFAHPETESRGVYIGPMEEAAYRSFEVVRVIGLTEHALPQVPRDNPILPDRLRERLNRRLPGTVRRGLTLSRASARRQLRDLYHLVQSTGREIVFTAPRKDRDGTKRSFSSLFVDFVLAGELSGSEIPDEPRIRQLMSQGRERLRQKWYPLRPLDRVTVNETGDTVTVPHEWARPSPDALDLKRVRALVRGHQDPGTLTELDGQLSDALPDGLFPGMNSDRPMSASAAVRFLRCPHWFLFQNMLGWEEPDEKPPVSEFSAMHFGSLVHRTAERLYRTIQEQDRDAGRARERLEEVVDQEFERMLEEYALVGEDTRRRERRRVREFMENLLELDRHRLGRRFQLEHRIESRGPDELHMVGYLDRVEQDGQGRAYIRDLKSGKARTDSKIVPHVDFQLGFYVELLEATGQEQTIEEVSFLYPSTPWHGERRFVRGEDESPFSLDRLQSRTRGWLQLMRGLISERVMPRTEDPDDCRWCPFEPVCGSRAQHQSRQKIESSRADWAQPFLNRKETDS